MILFKPEHVDVWREGYGSVDAYREAFCKIYGFWDPDVEVWVVDFERIL